MFFQDFGNKVRDLLEDNTYYNFKKVLKTKLTIPSNNVTWQTDSFLGPKGGCQSKIAASFKHSSGISIDKIQVKSDGKFLAQCSLQADDNLKFKMSAEDGRQDTGKPIKSHGEIGIEYVSLKKFYPASFAMESSVDVVNGPTISSSTVCCYKNIHIGGSIIYNTQLDEKDKNPEFIDYNVGIISSTNDSEMGLYTTKKASILNLGISQTVNDKCSIGIMGDYSLDKNAQHLTMGVIYDLEPDSKLACKINSSAVLSMGLSQQLNKSVNLSFSSQVDIKEWTSDSHKFGMALNIIG